MSISVKYDGVWYPSTHGWMKDDGVWKPLWATGSAVIEIEYLVIAGGGGASGFTSGAGAGGYIEGVHKGTLLDTEITVTVGEGGAGGNGSSGNPNDWMGRRGNDSLFLNHRAYGGCGGDGGYEFPPPGAPYGSSAGTATQTQPRAPHTEGQGNPGGGADVSSSGGVNRLAGGGGGAGGPAGDKTGVGGIGRYSSITGTSICRGGGGGGGVTLNQGGVFSHINGIDAVPGGGGSGGNGNKGIPGTSGQPNTGGGGGLGSTMQQANSGGSGVVIIAYPEALPNLVSVSSSLICNGAAGNATPDTTSRPGYKVYQFTQGSGPVVWPFGPADESGGGGGGGPVDPPAPTTPVLVITADGRGYIKLPADWNPNNNFIECYGAGGRGDDGRGAGGGGAYSRITNFGQPGQTFSYQVGKAADVASMEIIDPISGTLSPQHTAVFTDNYDYANDRPGYIFHCLAQGGQSVHLNGGAGTGGQASAGVGNVKHTGGNGANGAGAHGGGAAGPNGNGSNGGIGVGGAGDGGQALPGKNGDLYMPTRKPLGTSWIAYDPVLGRVGPSAGQANDWLVYASGGTGTPGGGLIVLSYEPAT